MREIPAPRGTRRLATVQEDWLAWLPDEKGCLFDATLEDLEKSYVILSVALNDSFTLCQQGKLVPAREGAAMFADLFDRVSGRLSCVLRTLDEHSRQFGARANVAPLCPDFFRSERAQQVARANTLISLLLFRTSPRFFKKLEAIGDALEGLQKEARKIADGIVDGGASSLSHQWTRLEVLHYDLNTCLRETTIVLKSFFCVLPAEQLAVFRKRLLSWMPVAIPVRSRRSAPVSPKLMAGKPEPDAHRSVASISAPPREAFRRPRQPRNSVQNKPSNKDNAGGKERILTNRMRSDGTGGPNETN